MKEQERGQVWRARLWCAMRTAAACAIVGLASLYGPHKVRALLTFPAFSYVTAILIVSQATLGDALRGCCHVAYASAQVAGLSVLGLWAIGPAWLARDEVAALAVAVVAFSVALPESTPLLCKRVAFGQTVIVFVGASLHGTGVFVLPTEVAASTALGALASVLALLFPFPRLAFSQVRKGCRLYAENASKRVSLIVEAISAKDTTFAHDFMSQLNTLSKHGPKLLQSVQNNLGGMAWERPQVRFMKPDFRNLGDRLRDMEIPIKGMEIALASCSTFPVRLIDQDLQQHLRTSQLQIGLKLEHVKCFVPFDAATAPEGKCEASDSEQQLLWTPKTSLATPENLPALFLLYCMEFLQDDPPIAQISETTHELKTEEPSEPSNIIQRASRRLVIGLPSANSFIFAFKCSVSLFLAVLFGLIYNKENGYWSGLTIAISFVTGRQATFTLANARGQGTAMGSVYGLLCIFLFQRCMDFRFVSLLPWIIFTGFLVHSKIYGQAGAFSAVIGALLIVGRKGYGQPTDFAIARITEATIGLLCYLLVELLMNPSRAATIAKAELSHSLGVLQDCVESISLFPNQKSVSDSRELRENQRRLKSNVKELEKFIAEAEVEPNFWFVPFNSGCYRKLLGSFSTLINLLHFVAYETEFLSEEAQRHGGDLEDLVRQINDDVEVLKKKVGYSMLRRLEDATSTVTVQVFKAKGDSPLDIELGKTTSLNGSTNAGIEEEKTLNCFFRHLEEAIDKVNACEGTAKHKRKMVLSLAGFGFCIHSLVSEVRAMEKEVKEVVKSENPSAKHKDSANIQCRK